jgi:hypothetical protein
MISGSSRARPSPMSRARTKPRSARSESRSHSTPRRSSRGWRGGPAIEERRLETRPAGDRGPERIGEDHGHHAVATGALERRRRVPQPRRRRSRSLRRLELARGGDAGRAMDRRPARGAAGPGCRDRLRDRALGAGQDRLPAARARRRLETVSRGPHRGGSRYQQLERKIVSKPRCSRIGALVASRACVTAYPIPTLASAASRAAISAR